MTASALFSKIESLPPLPEVCLRLREALDDPRCTVKVIAKLILQDPSLTSELLRLANSAYFSVPGGVGSVERAVQMMGFGAVQQLVLCAVSSQLLQRAGEQTPSWLTEHSQAVALLSHRLAAEAKIPLKELALAAGLLHDVGRLALLVVEPEKSRAFAEKVRAGAQPSLALEAECFGADHQQAGAWLGAHWKYPAALTEVISRHHTFAAESAALTDVVAVADGWVWELSSANTNSRFREVLDPQRAQRVGLPVAPPEHLLAELAQLVKSGGAHEQK